MRGLTTTTENGRSGTKVKGVLTSSALLAALAGTAIATSPAATAAGSYPDCVHSYERTTATGYCEKTDEPFIWNLSVQCKGWAVIGGNYTKWYKTGDLVPGEKGQVKCDGGNEVAIASSIVVEG